MTGATAVFVAGVVILGYLVGYASGYFNGYDKHKKEIEKILGMMKGSS